MLKGEKVSLYAVEKTDLEHFRNWRNNPDFRKKHFREYRELNMRQQEIWFEDKVVKDDTTLMFSIKENESNKLIDAVDLYTLIGFIGMQIFLCM